MGRAEAAQPLLATRVYGPRFRPEFVGSKLGPFVEHASSFGVPLVVVHPTSPARQEVHAFAATSGVHVIYSEPNRIPERYYPSSLINSGIRESVRRGHEYFGIISNDLAHYLPQVMPEMIRRLDQDPTLATVGVAIDSVHDTELLARVQQEGMGVVKPDNWATVWTNNALSLHRVSSRTNGYTRRDFEFDELFEDRLGYTEIGGSPVELQYNEEIERWLRSVKNGHPLKMMLLAGPHTLQRNPNKPDSASPFKKQRRQAVADSYRMQPEYAVSDDMLQSALRDHYQIAFDIAA